MRLLPHSPKDIIPRSIVIETLDEIPHMFVSLGDGSVISFVISNLNKSSGGAITQCELTERRKVVLGTQPTILRKFAAGGRV